MGNKSLQKSSSSQELKSSRKSIISQQATNQITSQIIWNRSQKSIQDVIQLMRQEIKWPQILRVFMYKITNKHQYQRYTKCILQEILYQFCNYDKFLTKIQNSKKNLLKSINEQTIKQQDNKNNFEQVQQSKMVRQPHSQESKALTIKQKQQLSQLFYFYKHKLQLSYFIIQQKGSIQRKPQNGGQLQFQTALKDLQNMENFQNIISPHQRSSNAYQNSQEQLQLQQLSKNENALLHRSYNSLCSILPHLMVTQIYQYSSIKQKYLNQIFIELNLKAYYAIQRFAQLLIQEFIVIDDQFNLSKFIVSNETMLQSLQYLQTCTQIIKQKQRQKVYKQIKLLKDNPVKFYIKMSYVFLKYKNPQAAQIVLNNLVQKGYRLNQKHLRHYLYVSLYNIFIYQMNATNSILKQHANEGQKQQLSGSSVKKQSIRKNSQENSLIHQTACQTSFIQFIQKFQKLSVQEILHFILLTKPYRSLQKIKKIFQNTIGLYQLRIGHKQFLKHLKNYALGQKSSFIITIQSLKNDLLELDQQQKSTIEQLFFKKLLNMSSNQIIEYQDHIIYVMNIYKFSKPIYEIIKVLIKVSILLVKFQISNTRLSELGQFIVQHYEVQSEGNRRKEIQKIKKQVFAERQIAAPSIIQQLQYKALIIIKKVITKFFQTSQHSAYSHQQQIIFSLQQFSNQDQTYQYTTKQIQSLFLLTQYLHKRLFQLFIPLQQLHQLLFQHMLYFYKYQQVQTMTKQQNLQRYGIQIEVVKMIILQNVRQMLIQSNKDITVISQDIKKQLKILERIVQKNSINSYRQNYQNGDNLQNCQQQQEIQSVRAIYKLLIKLDFYSISLRREEKENINIGLLYFLISHYQHQIEVFDYDEIYRLISTIQSKNSLMIGEGDDSQLKRKSSGNSDYQAGKMIVTNEYLKFKIDLAHLSFQKGKIKFGQQILKEVLEYQPPWISSQIIKIIKKTPQNISINENFLNIAFQYCVKGQDLIFLLSVWKHKQQQKLKNKNKKGSQKITELFQSTQKYMIIDDTYVKDEKQYRNLVAQMTFNDQTLKTKDYEHFFTLLGTQPERAFYLIYNKNLDIVKMQIIIKQGMKMGVFNISNTTKMFFKLLYTIFDQQRSLQNKIHQYEKLSYIKFKNLNLKQLFTAIQSSKLFTPQQKISKQLQKTIPYILLKKSYKSLKSLLFLPQSFIQNYIQNASSVDKEFDQNQLFYMFLYDENYREKHLIALKDQPMGKNDIKIYKDICSINGLNILDLVIFTLCNQLNTCQVKNHEFIFQQQNIQNMLQKIVTWTQNDQPLIQQILSKLIQKIFSSSTLYLLLQYLHERQNPLFRSIISQQHLLIIQSLKNIEINTQFHGLITQQYFSKPITLSPKLKLSQKHIKLLKKQLKLRNVFIISKIMYFCYGMSVQVEKQVLKLFVKENQNQQQKQLFEELKRKIQQSEQQ